MSHKNFTSETIRLEPCSSSPSVTRDNDKTLHLQAVIGANSQNFQKKKASSFQITSIRPTSSHSSNDGGDDSENDTEETSDILDSSKITTDFDQETPSFSEEYSKSEEMLLSSAPVIPGGLTALVQQAGNSGMMALTQGVTVSVTEDGLSLEKAEGEADNWQKRFTIVKINSNEPVKKGRWICLDFMDTPAVTSSESKGDEIPILIASNVVVPEGDSSKPPTHGLKIPVTGPGAHFYLHSATTQYFNPVDLSSSHITNSLAQNSNSTQVSQASTGIVQRETQVHDNVQGYASQQSQTNSSAQSLPVSSQSDKHPDCDIKIISSISSNVDIPQQGVQIGNKSDIAINKPEKSHQSPIISVPNPSQNSLGISTATHAITTQVISNSSQISISSTISQSLSHNQDISVSFSHPTDTQVITSQSISQVISSTQQLPNSNSSATGQSINFSSNPNTGVTPTPATTPAQATGILNIGANQISLPSDSQLQSLIQTSISGASNKSHPSSLDGLSLIHPNQDASGSTTATPPTGIIQADDSESASAASAVAIDNKIEQAMDLVKSHLMFAVREEVEVLKEKIVELTDRIHNLESENTVLRQYAPQEAVQQMAQKQLLPPSQAQQPATTSSSS